MDVSLSDLSAVLARTPAALRALLDGLPEPLLTQRPDENTFSALDVVGHLIHAEHTDWIPRLRLILEHGDSRPFEPFDRYGFREALQGRPAAELLDEFERLRRANLAVLEGLRLTPQQLTLPGRHPALGPVTLGQLLTTWAVHDLNHIAQAARLLSAPWADAVGPWRAYLRILNAG
jgi:hypothetical protein